MKDKKKQIKEQLEKTLNLSKKLLFNPKEPRNDEEQQMLDNIMDEINKLNDYMDEISTLEGTDGKKYKHKNGMLENENGETYIKSTDDNDYVFSIVDKNDNECKYTVYNKDSK